MSNFTESVVEDASLGWLEALGYSVLRGPDIAAGEPAAERSDPNYRVLFLKVACARRLCGSTQTSHPKPSKMLTAS